MSDAPTPRTDKEEFDSFELASMKYPQCVNADFARHLERENDQLAKQCVVFVEEIGLLRLELEEANKDKARMDYLVSNKQYGIIREGIDAVMEAANNE